MKILVDADACPVKEIIISVARSRGVEVILVASLNHRMSPQEGVEVIVVDYSPQAVDLVIANRVTKEDVVVTQDYGLAALALGKKARALSPRGLIFSERNIDELLLSRHLSAKIRRGGGRTKGPSAFSSDDREKFRAALEMLIAVTG